MNPQNHHTTHSKVISHVFFTGTAKQGCAGPPIGLVDIGVSEVAYLFRVALPGIEKNQNKIKCEIQREGRVCIQGVVPELAIPSDSGCLYRMQVQQLCPPGPFSITFNLPGQVDPRLFSPKFRPDGIFEVVVLKLGAIIVAGMGLFTDAYDLFCIAPVMKMISHIYYHKESIGTAVLSTSYALALLGTALGQLFFGYLGDRVGRQRVYGLCLLIMILSSFGGGFSVCTTRRSCVMASLGFFRFVLGLGIGGDYPLSATIMSEFANKRTRGAFIAAVFSMQGLGILTSSAVTMAVCQAFKNAGEGSSETTRAAGVETMAPAEADIAWRLILMIGALPAALTFYWRMLMPETARYTALVENNAIQAAKDMQRVMSEAIISQIAEDSPSGTPQQVSSSASYKLFSRRFLSLHGRDLFAASANWFLVDVVFYTSNLLLSQIFNFSNKPLNSSNVYDSAFEVARLAAIVAACSTIPGYWFTVYFIDRIGRVKIQIMGFFFMALVYLVAGIPYSWYWSKHEKTNKGFMVLYGLIFFFSNFGPNTTTFIVPAELFPARFRSTCHGISGAAGKLGAIVGTVGFLWATKHAEEDKDDVFPDVKRVRIAFLILGGVCIAGVLVTYFFTRETMGRSLEENEEDDIGSTSTAGSSSANELLPRQY